MTFSILIVRPTKSFFEWLKELARGRGVSPEDIYFPEEDGVWLIPAVGTFSDSTELETYLTQLKPLIVKRELGKFGLTPEQVPDTWTAELCDRFLSLELRDSATVAEIPIKTT